MVKPLQGIGHIAVLIDPPIILIKVFIHQVRIELRGDFAHLSVLLTVNDIRFGCFAVRGRK